MSNPSLNQDFRASCGFFSEWPFGPLHGLRIGTPMSWPMQRPQAKLPVRVAVMRGVPDVESPVFPHRRKGIQSPISCDRTERIFRRGHICGNQQQPAIAEFPPLEAQSVFRPVVHAWEPAVHFPERGLRKSRRSWNLRPSSVSMRMSSRKRTAKGTLFSTRQAIHSSPINSGPRAGLQLMTLQTNEDALDQPFAPARRTVAAMTRKRPTSKAL